MHYCFSGKSTIQKTKSIELKEFKFDLLFL